MERDEVLREILALIKDEARDLGHYGDRPSYAARIKQHADAALALLEPAPEPEPQPEPPGPGVAEYERFLRWSAEHAEPGHIYPPTAAVPQDGTLREALERLADKWFAAGWVVATTKTERGVGKGMFGMAFEPDADPPVQPAPDGERVAEYERLTRAQLETCLLGLLARVAEESTGAAVRFAPLERGVTDVMELFDHAAPKQDALREVWVADAGCHNEAGEAYGVYTTEEVALDWLRAERNERIGKTRDAFEGDDECEDQVAEMEALLEIKQESPDCWGMDDGYEWWRVRRMPARDALATEGGSDHA
jgi:hypothetical protein